MIPPRTLTPEQSEQLSMHSLSELSEAERTAWLGLALVKRGMTCAERRSAAHRHFYPNGTLAQFVQTLDGRYIYPVDAPNVKSFPHYFKPYEFPITESKNQ